MSKARAALLMLSNSATFTKTRMSSRCCISWAYQLPRRLIALATIMVLLLQGQWHRGARRALPCSPAPTRYQRLMAARMNKELE
jgi:hypothetical protein